MSKRLHWLLPLAAIKILRMKKFASLVKLNSSLHRPRDETPRSWAWWKLLSTLWRGERILNEQFSQRTDDGKRESRNVFHFQPAQFISFHPRLSCCWQRWWSEGIAKFHSRFTNTTSYTWFTSPQHLSLFSLSLWALNFTTCDLLHNLHIYFIIVRMGGKVATTLYALTFHDQAFKSTW